MLLGGGVLYRLRRPYLGVPLSERMSPDQSAGHKTPGSQMRWRHYPGSNVHRGETIIISFTVVAFVDLKKLPQRSLLEHGRGRTRRPSNHYRVKIRTLSLMRVGAASVHCPWKRALSVQLPNGTVADSMIGRKGIG